MIIRRATLLDVPTLVSLNRSVQAMHADAFPDRFRRPDSDEAVTHAFGAMIGASSSYWLVAQEEEVIAFLSAEFRERLENWCLVRHEVCYIAGVVVKHQFQRKGIAKALIAELRREAAGRYVTRIELDVWAFNEQAKQVFRKLGFQSQMERMTLIADAPNTALKPVPI
jgi:ribosomal protein S18 acetylase RimI-like enzyme